jgi:hypothetical protein
VALTFSIPAVAEDVEKKLRLSVALGGYNPLDDVQSNSANTLTVVDRVKFNEGTREVVDFFRDPRDDNAAFGALDVRSGTLGTLALQYALTKTFLLEASVGYIRSDVGDLEVAVELDGDPPPIEEITFQFSTFNVKAGELTRIPIQLDAIFRFRPRAKFNPYVGVGIGYSIVGFDTTDDLDALSVNLDTQIGIECQLTSSFAALATMPCRGPSRDLQGIEIDAGDSFEFNAVLGGEVSIKRKMAMFADLRYVGASRDVSIRVDTAQELGVSVPQLVDFDDSIAAVTAVEGGYGAVRIGTPIQTDVGLVDAGYRILVPAPDNPSANCSFPNPDEDCVQKLVESPGAGQLVQNFLGEIYRDTDPGVGDGRRDPGRYYVQGGTFSWSGLSLQVGFRYTF